MKYQLGVGSFRGKFLCLLAGVLASCLAWLPASAPAAPTRGFVVDASIRAEVVSFYHAVYQASEGYENRINWTGVYNSTAAGAEGTVSPAFVADVERRLNFHRAMAGVKADVRVNSGATVNITAGDLWIPSLTTTKAEAAQRSALMIIRTYPGNGALSHNPATSCTAWTTAAWNANKNGNLALGFYGPGAVDAYMKEDVAGISSWNVDVGHRRWLLTQWATDFGTGDTPGSFAGGTPRPPTNVMYAVPKLEELDFTPPLVFAPYPSAGYFPAGLNTPYWSVAYPGADFSAATVTLRDADLNVVPVTVVSRRVGLGDNALVWQVPAAAAVTSVGADETWHVTVAGIGGLDVPAEYSYQVTLIDPERLNESPQVSGPASPTVAGAVYQIDGIDGAEQVEAGIFLRRAASWIEGAESSPEPRVIADTGGTYPFLSTTAGYVRSGSRAFRLTFPTYYDPLINGVPEQSFELDRELLAGPGATLDFHYRRGLMTSASKLAVEFSDDGGLSWSGLGTPIAGLGGSGDATFHAASLPLPAGSGPLRVRFRYYLETPGAAMYSHEVYPSQPTGIFIDDIAAAGCDWLDKGGSVQAANLSSFTFDSATAGIALDGGQEWWLRARALLGGHAFPYGPPRVVRPLGPLQLIGSPAPPVSGANYRFIPAGGADSYLLEVVQIEPADWLEGAENLPAPSIADGTAATYELSSSLNGYRKSGSFSFRLGLSSAADNEDWFAIEREILPSASSELSFWSRRGRMSKTNFLHAELSADQGATWTSLWSLPGKGGTNTDAAMTLQTIPLAPWAGGSVKLRFAVRKAPGGANATWNATSSGAWVDDIAVSAAQEVGAASEIAIPAEPDVVRLDPPTVGEIFQENSTLRLRLRVIVGGTPGGWGPPITVAPVAAPEPGFAAWQEYEFPGQLFLFEDDDDGDGLANGIEYAFSLDPLDGLGGADEIALPAGRLEISRDLPEERLDVDYAAEWSDDLSEWSAEGVEVVVADGRITASAPFGTGSGFLRWKITLD